MRRRRAVAGFLGLLVFLLFGLALRSSICVWCDGRGPVDLTWCGMRLFSLTARDSLFDDFRTVELWEHLRDRRCDHEWHFRSAVAFIVRREHGAPLGLHFERGRGPAALQALAREDKEWARRTWEVLRDLPREAQAGPMSSLEDLGVVVLQAEYAGRKFPRDEVLSWLGKNQEWILGAGAAKPK